MDESKAFNRGVFGPTGSKRCFQRDSRARGSVITRGVIKRGTMCSAITVGGTECNFFARPWKKRSFSLFVFKVRLLRKSVI